MRVRMNVEKKRRCRADTHTPMIPTTIRAGLAGDDERGGGDEYVETVIALLRVFGRDAIRVSGRYACARGSRSVTGEMMRCSLKYCARTFFDRTDLDLEEVVRTERETMRTEEDTDEEDSSSYDGDEDDEEDEDDEKKDDEETVADESDVQLARNVDLVVEHWDKWHPEDPVLVLVKRAIDNTPA